MEPEPHPVIDSSSTSIFGTLTPESFYTKHKVTYTESFLTNSRGLQQCIRSWTLIDVPVRAVICGVHGYGADSGWLFQLTCIHLAKQGYAVYGIDHQGHGKSEGLKGHLPDMNAVVDDCIEYFDKKREERRGLPYFLYGESLGGAISVLIHLKQKEVWKGLVLNGAMCGIGRFKPPMFAVHLLPLVASIVPTWPIVPTKDIPLVSFSVPWKRELSRINPNRYTGRPRLGTALELLRVVKEIETRASEVTAPLLICHGEEDVVCDPEGSKMLYKNAGSTDKTLHVYPGMWHQLVGEPKEGVALVFGHITSWLESHLPS